MANYKMENRVPLAWRCRPAARQLITWHGLMSTRRAPSRAAQPQPTSSSSIGAVTAARLTAPSVTVRPPHSALCHSPPATQRPLSQSASHTAPSVTVRQTHSAICHSPPDTQRHLSQSASHTAPSVTVRQSHSAICHSPPVTRPALLRLGESDKYDLG